MIRKIKRYEINEVDTGTLRETAPGDAPPNIREGLFYCRRKGKRCMNAAFVLTVLYKSYLYASKCRPKAMLAVLHNGCIYAYKCRIKVVFMFAVLRKGCFMCASAV